MNLEKMFKTPKRKSSCPDDVKTAHCEAEDLFLELATQLDALPESREKSLCMTKITGSEVLGGRMYHQSCTQKLNTRRFGAQRQPLFYAALAQAGRAPDL